MKSWFRHIQPLIVAAAVGIAFGACDEQLDSGAACPALCPVVEAPLRDTTFFAVDLDTSLTAFPVMGEELRMFVASMGDTLQTRGVIRYDSLPKTFRHNNSVADTGIFVVDTGAYIKLAIVNGDTTGAPTTVEAYDVDMGGPDDSDPTLAANGFTAARLLGSRTMPAASLRDSLKIPIDPAVLLAKIKQTPPMNRLRVGLKVSGSGKSSIIALTTNAQNGAQLIFRPAADTSVPLTVMFPRSKQPADAFVQMNLADYTLVTLSPPPPPANAIRAGGAPGSRAYLRFNIPSFILDSSAIVRATLQLTQSPKPKSPFASDTLEIQAYAILASQHVTDLTRAIQLLDLGACPVRPDTVFPKDSAVRTFEMINVVKCWRGTTATKTPRALAIVSGQEGVRPTVFDFFSSEAPASVRPRLRITYLPKREEGLP